jgi:hypothetical protein
MRTLDWKARVRAIGYGTPTELDSKAALDIAKAATPRGDTLHDPAYGDFVHQRNDSNLFASSDTVSPNGRSHGPT